MRWLIALAIGLIWHVSAIAAPAWVQTQVSTFVGLDGIVTSATYTLLHSFTSGNALVGALYYENPPGGTYLVSSITDNAGNTYSVLDHLADNIANNWVVSFGLATVVGNPTTITVHYSSAPAGGNEFMWADECSGVGAIDAHGQGNNPSSVSTVTSGNITANAADLVLGYFTPDTGTAIGAGASFTLRNNDTTNGLYSESRLLGAPGATAATFAITSGTGIVNVIALRPTCASLALLGVGC